MADLSSRDWPAPAKLNLFLHIIGRRDDGYHLLQTVFQFVDCADRLHFTVCDKPRIQLVSAIQGIPPAQDLCYRAANLLQQQTGCRQGVDIELEKNLPLGGGLGGGSSDAATVLVALNQLWQTGLDTEQLAALGLQLGADVPVFVHGHAAWAEGVGEQLVPIQPDEPWYCILVPAVSVSTAAVFGDPDLTRNTPPIKIADFCQGQGHNDCETVVRCRYPEVGEAIDWLTERSAGLQDCVISARMTGSGACVFAGFSSRQSAQTLAEQCPSTYRVILARGANRSPLLDRSQQQRAG